MGIELSEERARRLRSRAQGLADDTAADSVAAVVRRCCGLQAQDARQAPLGIRARGRGLTAIDVAVARVDDRTVARTWCMRGTLHYVATDDLSWLLSLFGPLYVDRGRRRLADLGFDADDAEHAVATLREAVADDGPLTRDEIAARLLDEGYAFDPDGQAPFHLVRRACLAGVAIEAAPRDGTATYALLDDWVSLDPAPDRDDALAELARRYVTAYEPATPDDLYAWSGLHKRDVRAGWDAIEADLHEVEVGGERAWTRSPPLDVELDDAPTVRLLPMYDGYFLGHEDRELVVPAEHADRVYPGGGVVRATVLVDGLAAGTWTLSRSGGAAELAIEPFEPFDEAVAAEIEVEVGDVGRFLDREIEYRITDAG